MNCKTIQETLYSGKLMQSLHSAMHKTRSLSAPWQSLRCHVVFVLWRSFCRPCFITGRTQRGESIFANPTALVVQLLQMHLKVTQCDETVPDPSCTAHRIGSSSPICQTVFVVQR
jgi:hypothetical protein